MDNDGTAAIPLPVVANAFHHRFRGGMFAAMRPTTLGGNEPTTRRQPKLASSGPVWPVAVLELDVRIELQPALLPAPQRGAVDTALPSCYGHWQSLLDEQADCVRPGFW